MKNIKKDAVFGISLGDLVGDDLSLHPLYIDAVKEIGTYTATLKLHKEVTIDVAFEVVAE